MQKMYTCMTKCISSCTENGLARILLLKWSGLKTGGKIKGVPPLIGRENHKGKQNHYSRDPREDYYDKERYISKIPS